jgi:hypothetical protein
VQHLRDRHRDVVAGVETLAAEQLVEPLDGQAARDVAGGVATKAVRDDEQVAFRGAQERVLLAFADLADVARSPGVQRGLLLREPEPTPTPVRGGSTSLHSPPPCVLTYPSSLRRH